MKLSILFISLFTWSSVYSQVLSPELLWSVGRVGAVGLSDDGSTFVYKVTTPNIVENSFESKLFSLNMETSTVSEIENANGIVRDDKVSPDGAYKLLSEEVQIKKMLSTDIYPELEKSDAYVFDALHYRHWDTWENGYYGHVMIENLNDGSKVDLMKGEPYDCPTVPFGGSEDYIWHPNGKSVVYVTKRLFGTDYVNSTNTDLFKYDLSTKTTINLTESNKGYDTNPQYSAKGVLAYLSMMRDGYEADKNDLKVILDGKTVNLTAAWDGTVNSFIWSEDGKMIYFTAPTRGTVHLFSVPVKAKENGGGVKQITQGVFDLNSLAGFSDGDLIAGRNDMNRAREFFKINLKNGSMEQITRVNDDLFAGIKTGKIESRMVATTDGKEMLVWVIYPPDFDPAKKYPTLLYAQGGPQGALSQFYSYRWNFQLMAAQGYIVVAPNRRGMPGYGVEWNEVISKDWGGQCMQDYLSAIDDMAKESFVDEDRLGCVGASFGGYSAFYLAGIHENRFKSFIAHDGVFNLRSMYGTTEELFFVNWDTGGPYWDKSNSAAQKTYSDFDPSNFVANWNTPIFIIQGGRDYRVPIGQGLEAFTAAQQQGIKSRLLYLPEENHWVLQPQNGLVWQREFFKWLSETL